MASMEKSSTKSVVLATNLALMALVTTASRRDFVPLPRRNHGISIAELAPQRHVWPLASSCAEFVKDSDNPPVRA